MSQRLVEAFSLGVGYEKKEVVGNLSFHIDSGDYLCIIGHNGAGKTTLMKTLLQLIKPISGKIEFYEDLRKGGIGYLPQQNGAQREFPATVMEVVLSGLIHKKGLMPFYTKQDKLKAEECLTRIGAIELKKKCFGELSGGQQQRVLLARALLGADSILLVDEPVSGLDVQASEDMYRILEDLHKEGMAIIMITHDVTTALKYATHILIIGEESFFGTREEFATTEFATKKHIGGHDHHD